MEMQQIRYFLTLARTLNFTRAAEECNVTQPALTRAIQALEQELGGDLLRRERQHSHLTDLGKRMLPLLQQCYDSARTAKAVARSVKSNEVAPLALAVSHSVNIELLMPFVGELFRTIPGIQLNVLRGDGQAIFTILKDGEAELAIAGPMDASWGRLDSWPLFCEPFELAAHQDNPIATSNALTLERLAGQTILFHAGCESKGDIFSRMTPDAVKGHHSVATQHDLMSLLEANIGVAIVPASAPKAELIRRARLQEAALHRTVSLYAIAGRQRSTAGGALFAMLRAADWTGYET